LKSTIGYYNFSNIRYAQPPVGNLRFAAPVPPRGRSTEVNKGAVGSICPQANPLWLLIAQNFTTSLASGVSFNASAAFVKYEAILANLQSFASKPDPRTTEDCLFLDVMVPKEVFENKKKDKGAAVLVWIYGGGYTAGSKSEPGNPAGLIKASQSSGGPGVIYVAMNYRVSSTISQPWAGINANANQLGALGWSVGPTYQGDGGTANAGLYDQRLALQWVQKYIHLFGGDPKRVTVFGDSAGGGSILHQITAYGGAKGSVPFQQALPQSPGFVHYVSPSLQENTWNSFLLLCNVTSLEEARKLPSKVVITANSLQVATSQRYGVSNQILIQLLSYQWLIYLVFCIWPCRRRKLCS
jgi:carboxylesterase type B